MYIKSIKLNKSDYPGSHVINKKFKFICEDVNLFVGDQGTGKSTLLYMLRKQHKSLNLKLDKHLLENQIDTKYFNTEIDNPRIKDGNSLPNEIYVSSLLSRFLSHGETMTQIINDGIEKTSNCIFFIDEPESGLSLKNQYRLVQNIKNAVLRKCQFFIATHSFILIENFDVFSFDEWIKMTGVEYIKKQKQLYHE